jgi:hypothetical protein
MTSILIMMINVVINALVYLAKAVFSLLLWFIKTVTRALKLFFVALPITSIVFGVLMLVTMGTVLFVTSGGEVTTGTVLSDTFVDGSRNSARAIPAVSMFSALKAWWMDNVYSFKGTSTYILLLFLTILMFIPVMTVFLAISVFASYGAALFIAFVADAALYVVRASLGKGFVTQALSRYYRLFPKAGRRHEERRYDRLMKERNNDLEAENRARRQRRGEAFYEDENYLEDHDDEYSDEGYDPEFDEEYGSDDEYYEDGYDNEDYSDDDYPEDDEFYEEDSDDEGYYGEDDEYYEDDDGEVYDDEEDFDDEDKDDTSDYDAGFEDGRRAAGTFDFFAGCNSRESVDKKYKSLVKLYHPDNMDGDTAALQEINSQYEAAKKKWN